MERRIRRRSRQNRRRQIGLSVVVTLAVALSLLAYHQGPRVIKIVDDGKQAVLARASSLMKLEHVSWDESGSTNLSRRVTRQMLWDVSGLKLGDELLKLDLVEFEKRLLAVPWIESVQIQKRLPSSLAVRYSVHHARALGLRRGKPWLISSSGKWIAPASSEHLRDFPVLAGEGALEVELKWLETLETELSPHLLQIHEVNGRGSPVSVVSSILELQYRGGAAKISVVSPASPNAEMLNRLKRVVHYLIKNNILVSTIDIRPGKKVVVNVGKRP